MSQEAGLKSRAWRWAGVFGLGLTIVGGALGGYLLGQRTSPVVLPPLAASTSAVCSSMAVATGKVSENVEGVFFLDFVTGDLQCLVYYPRIGAFAARYSTNVLQHLPANGRNAQYLMVTGDAIPTGNTGAARPGNSLVYITDATSGTFAAYAVPYDRTAEAAEGSNLVRWYLSVADLFEISRSFR